MYGQRVVRRRLPSRTGSSADIGNMLADRKLTRPLACRNENRDSCSKRNSRVNRPLLRDRAGHRTSGDQPLYLEAHARCRVNLCTSTCHVNDDFQGPLNDPANRPARTHARNHRRIACGSRLANNIHVSKTHDSPDHQPAGFTFRFSLPIPLRAGLRGVGVARRSGLLQTRREPRGSARVRFQCNGRKGTMKAHYLHCFVRTALCVHAWRLSVQFGHSSGFCVELFATTRSTSKNRDDANDSRADAEVLQTAARAPNAC